MKAETKTFHKQLGKNIRTIRAMQGRTQKEIAAHLDMSIANFSNIENGYIVIDSFKLNQLAVIFSIKESDIIEFHLHPFFQQNNHQ